VTGSDDRVWMERALFHAERGRGRTSPNPIVGAVVVDANGIVVGQGAHLGAGGPHAEVVALDGAGARARAGTLYCTLEPCSHVGRTGPCVERIRAAGVRRVVAASGDRNPRVAGQGFAYLRSHGIEVVEGVGLVAAEHQLAPFFTWVTKARPFVIAKAATSRDGFIGRADRRVALTGARANRYFHRQRAEVDAIAVGSGTVLADDPELTARGAYRFRPLTRVIFDWRGRVGADARVFSTLLAGPVIMVVSQAVVEGDPARFARLTERGIVIHATRTRDVRPVLGWLAGRDVLTLLVEGGAALHTAFANVGVIDRVQWIVTPQHLGSGVPAAALSPEAFGASGTRTLLGRDELIEFDVHRTG
jgi:diaminohydroxyphosphoribosylaminopyrimidine deaminase / 5-amino-6-(5-phosphoribosylamino)uracil reductase